VQAQSYRDEEAKSDRHQESTMNDTSNKPAVSKTVPAARDQRLRDMANCIRFLTVDFH
jgi:hypothetical protein